MIETFVFDTNALISAYILANSKNRKAYDKAFAKGVIVYSATSFDEFAETFVRQKFEKYLALHRRLLAIEEFQTKAALIVVETSITVCRDPKDNKFLELAVAANASCIITGDKDLLVLHPFRKIPILNAIDFINNF